MRTRLLAVIAISASLLAGHPLGNFSVNHYAKFDAGVSGVGMQYAIDLAEIPTFELVRDWGLDRSGPREELDRKAEEQARTWISHLSMHVDGKPARPIFESAQAVIADGAGGLPVLRISIRMHVTASDRDLSHRFEYEDHNFEGRAGWKEIVIAAEDGAQLNSASQSAEDRSQALTAYPPNPMLAPPQDLRAEFQWTAERQLTMSVPRTAPAIVSEKPSAPVIRTIPQPAAMPAPPSSAMTAKTAPAGTVVRNDFLSRLLRRGEIPLSMMFVALLVAFGLGAAHALTPGHGKTIVAAYLVGSRGTLKHAAFLGAMVTFTHTISVFALGLATLFLFRFIVPERITEILGVVSGLSIAVIGCGMLWKRIRGTRLQHGHSHGHSHGDSHHHAHDHDHEHEHGHDHDEHAHSHDHAHSGAHAHTHDHVHHHGPGGHTHVPDGEISWGSLVTLAVSGGLVPCESALVLLLSAIALGRVGLGLLLLVSFSLGLAGVLMAIGAIVLYTKRVLPEAARHSHSPWARWVPVASAAVVMVLGVMMTGVSLGWLPVGWLAG
jgi:ABC-type nickel/cobalt efflux system permease component RcnA